MPPFTTAIPPYIQSSPIYNICVIGQKDDNRFLTFDKPATQNNKSTDKQLIDNKIERAGRFLVRNGPLLQA